MATDFNNDVRVRVNWGGGLTTSEYPSIGGLEQNCILSLSGIDTSVASDNVSTAGQCAVVLNERDIEFQTLLPTQMNRSPASVTVNGVVVFVGETRACTWGENKRELSFSIVSRVRHGEVGYAMGDSTGSTLNAQARGKPWPICFGTPRKARGLRVQQIREAKTMYPISVCDDLGAIESMWKYYTRTDWYKANSTTIPTVASDALQAQDVYFTKMHVRETTSTNGAEVMNPKDQVTITDCAQFLDETGEPPEDPIVLDIGGTLHEGTLTKNVDKTLKFTITTPNKVKWEPNIAARASGDPDEKNPTVVFLENTLDNLRRRFEGNWFTVTFNDPDGRVGPSGTETVITDTKRIFSAKIIGQKGLKLYLDTPANKLAAGSGDCLFKAGTACKIYGSHPSGFTNAIDSQWDELKKSVLQQSVAVSNSFATTMNLPAAAQQAAAAPLIAALKANAQNMFASWQAGTYVRAWLDKEYWVVNGVASTKVKKVWTSKGVPVPNYLYTTDLSYALTLDGVPRVVTRLAFDYPLSSYYGDLDITDDLCFATVHSTISANPVSQIAYLRANYTDFAQGVGWANAVAKLVKYEAHWCLYDIRDAMELIKDIAFQCVCGIRTDLEVMDCIYLGEEGATGTPIDETNSMWESAFSGFMDDGKLVTQVVTKWAPDGSVPEQKYTKASTTAERYGLARFKPSGINVPYRKNTALEDIQSYNFFIYNNLDAVKSVSDFWLTRLSHIWRVISFATKPDVAVAHVFDWMTLDYEFGSIADTGMVLEHGFDPSTGINNYKVMLKTATEGDGATPFLTVLAATPENPSDLDIDYTAMMSYGHEYKARNREGKFKGSRPSLMGIVTETNATDPGEGVAIVEVALYEMGWFKPLTRTVDAVVRQGLFLHKGEKVIVHDSGEGRYSVEYFQEAE